MPLSKRLLGDSERLTLGGYFAAERANLQRYPRELYLALARQQLHANEEVRARARAPRACVCASVLTLMRAHLTSGV